jgi:hypothetical protein
MESELHVALHLKKIGNHIFRLQKNLDIAIKKSVNVQILNVKLFAL